MIRSIIKTVSLISILSVNAFGTSESSNTYTHKIQSCKDAGVDLTSIVFPAKSNIIDLVQSEVSILKIDQIEPANAPYGIAVIMPDASEEQEMPNMGPSCKVITGFGNIDFKRAHVSKGTGENAGYTLVKFKTSYNDPETSKKTSSSITLKILVGEQESTLQIIP